MKVARNYEHVWDSEGNGVLGLEFWEAFPRMDMLFTRYYGTLRLNVMFT